MNKIYVLKIGVIFIVAISCSLGCQPSLYQDISNSISPQPLPVPDGEFESVAWVDENHIAFIYRPEKLTATDINKGSHIGIFEISTGTTKDLSSLTLAPDCYPTGSDISNLSKLPYGSLGFIFNCVSSEYNLYLLDQTQMKL